MPKIGRPKIKRKVVFCSYCNKKIKIRVTENRKYCSLDCHYKNNNGENNSSKRLDVREKISKKLQGRINFWSKRCIVCGRLKNKDFHICPTEEELKRIYSNPIRNRKLSKILKNRKITWCNKLSETRKKLYAEGKIVNWNKGKIGLQVAWNKGLRKGVDEKMKSCGNHSYNKISNILKIKNKDPEFMKKRLMACIKKPNKKELFLDDILQSYFPNKYRYIGNGQFIIGTKNPDFINMDNKTIIELFGDYWHSYNITKLDNKTNESNRINYFKKYGYNTLIIWEHELKNLQLLIKKIESFISQNKGELAEALPMENIQSPIGNIQLSKLSANLVSP